MLNSFIYIHCVIQVLHLSNISLKKSVCVPTLIGFNVRKAHVSHISWDSTKEKRMSRHTLLLHCMYKPFYLQAPIEPSVCVHLRFFWIVYVPFVFTYAFLDCWNVTYAFLELHLLKNRALTLFGFSKNPKFWYCWFELASNILVGDAPKNLLSIDTKISKSIKCDIRFCYFGRQYGPVCL